MERPIGDKFKLNGCVYVVVQDAPLSYESGCKNCVFLSEFCSDIINIRGYCTRGARSDMKGVHFEHFGVDF